MIRQGLIVFFTVFIITGMSLAQSGEDQVKEAYNKYKASLIVRNGTEASKYVDQQTIDYYNNILSLAIHADSLKINELNLIDRLVVLSIRHRTSKEEILSFNGESILIHGINKGMVGKSSVEQNEIGDVIIDNNSAKGQIIVAGQLTPYHFEFHKEGGQWKINLNSIMNISRASFKQMQEESTLNENDFLFYLLDWTTGRMPDNNIWQPLK